MFYKTTRSGNGRASHYHIVYISVAHDEISAIMSVEGEHSHGVTVNYDAGSIEKALKISKNSGHSHAIDEKLVNKPISFDDRKDKTKLSQRIQELKRVAEDIEKDFRQKAIESEGYYDGSGQWDESVVRDKDKKQLSAVTINEIQNKLHILSGYLRQNRTDIKYYPTEDGDEIVADVLTHVVKNITEQSNYSYEETEAFEDAIITGRGFLCLYMDYERNINGQIMIRHIPWDDCLLGPHKKKDLSDLEYMMIAKKFSFEKLKHMYPGKAKDIENDIKRFEELNTIESPLYENTSDPYFGSGVQQIKDNINSYIDIANQKYTQITTWQKIYTRVHVFIFNGEVVNGGEAAIGWKSADIEKIKTIQGFNVVSPVRHDIRVTKTAGMVVLEDYLDDDVEGDFPIIPIYAIKRKNTLQGKVESAKGAQNILNKGISHYVDQVNRTGSSGHVYTDESFNNPQDARAFKDNVSTPGFFLKVSSYAAAPQPKEPPQVSPEVPRLIEVGSIKVRDAMGVIPELEGINTRAESGIAIMEKKRQGLIGNEFLFDNLSLAKKLLGRVLVKMIRNNYTTERILRLLVNRSRKNKLQVAGQQLDPNDLRLMEGIGIALNEANLLNYDVVVSESEFSPTIRNATFVMLSELARNGFGIPEEAIIEISPLPDKDKYIEMIRQKRAAEAQAEERKYQVELQKSGKSGMSPQQQQILGAGFEV